MHHPKSLPTQFAKMIALGVDLLPCPECDITSETVQDYNYMRDQLASFQQLAISGTFDEAMLAYYGLRLDDDKKQALQLIYNTTKPWLLGHTVGVLLQKLESDMASGRDVTEQARFIVDSFGSKSGLDGKTKKSLLKVILAKGE